ncbi:MAG: TonB-dependent receptor [Gammaproteobacteria bacterium]|nr:TonB-dependent receptor [Gammaproteobacteria bacterium]
MRNTLLRAAVLGELVAAAAGMALMTPMVAIAQEQARPTALEEVVVTARKREETVLEVPIAISAISAKEIAAAGITNINDLNGVAPGLNFIGGVGNGPGGRSQGSVVFRGMAPTTGAIREQSGSLFVDGMYVSGGPAAVDTSDVERIEVLRGPQNAYFGRSTFGGAVNFITRTPGEELKGEVSLSGGNFGSWGANASVEGGLIDGKLTGRLSGVSFKRGAQYTSADGGALGEEKTQSITGTLYATPTDNWSIRLRLHLQQDDDGPVTNSYIRGMQYGSTCPGETFRGADADGNSVSFALSRPYFCGSNPLPSIDSLPDHFITANTSMYPAVLASIGRPNLWHDLVVNNSTNNPLMARAPHMTDFGMRRDVTRIALQSDYTFANDISLVTNFGYNENSQITVYDVDRADVENAYAALPAFDDSWSAELRLQSGQEQKLRWMIGASYFEYNVENQQIGYQINVRYGGALPTAPYANTRTDETYTVPALFGSIEYDILDNLTVGADARYQKDKTETVNFTTSTTSSFEFTNTLPRVFVRYEPIPDLSLYATWGQGVSPGQLNGNFANYTESQKAEICAQFPTCGALAPLPEVDNYELGIKQRLFDGRAQYSVSVYQMDWKNINTGVSVVVSTTPFVLGFIAPNNATMKGIELEGSMLITDAWDVGMSLSYQKNEYDDFYNPTVGTLTSGVTHFDGNNLPKAPDSTAMLTSTYRGALGNSWNWFVRGDVIYTGKIWDSEANIYQIDSYTKMNARLGFDNEQFSIEIYGRNLFNDDSWVYTNRSTSLSEPGALLQVPYNGSVTTVQGNILTPSSKREFGAKVTYRF